MSHPSKIELEPIKENDMYTKEPHVCSSFGCPNHLTLKERLFGDKCMSHSGDNRTKLLDKKIKIYGRIFNK